MKLKFSIILFLLITFSSCIEKNTTNPKEAYSYWIKSDMNSKVEVVNGKYWESSHFSHEYIIYLELKIDSDWWTKFSKENELVIDTYQNENFYNNDFPKWFKPSKEFVAYKSNTDSDQGSMYFYNEKTQSVFIYEIQL